MKQFYNYNNHFLGKVNFQKIKLGFEVESKTIFFGKIVFEMLNGAKSFRHVDNYSWRIINIPGKTRDLFKCLISFTLETLALLIALRITMKNTLPKFKKKLKIFWSRDFPEIFKPVNYSIKDILP